MLGANQQSRIKLNSRKLKFKLNCNFGGSRGLGESGSAMLLGMDSLEGLHRAEVTDVVREVFGDVLRTCTLAHSTKRERGSLLEIWEPVRSPERHTLPNPILCVVPTYQG